MEEVDDGIERLEGIEGMEGLMDAQSFLAGATPAQLATDRAIAANAPPSSIFHKFKKSKNLKNKWI